MPVTTGTTGPQNQGHGEVVNIDYAAVAAAGLRIEKTDPFALKAHPVRWNVFSDPDSGEPLLLPVLGRISHSPGTNNVNHRGETGMAYGGAIRNGWTPIPQSWCTADDTPDKQPGYLRRWRTASGGYYYDLVWAKPYAVGDQVLFQADKGYVRWVKKLVASGLIPPCPDEVRDVLLDRASRREGRHIKAAGTNPYEAGQVEAARKWRKQIEEATIPGSAHAMPDEGEILDAADDFVVPEPVPTPRRARKPLES